LEGIPAAFFSLANDRLGIRWTERAIRPNVNPMASNFVPANPLNAPHPVSNIAALNVERQISPRVRTWRDYKAGL